MYIFEFQTLSYDNTISDESLIDSINSIFKDDYLKAYTPDFVEAGKQSKVNPIYLELNSQRDLMKLRTL